MKKLILVPICGLFVCLIVNLIAQPNDPFHQPGLGAGIVFIGNTTNTTAVSYSTINSVLVSNNTLIPEPIWKQAAPKPSIYFSTWGYAGSVVQASDITNIVTIIKTNNMMWMVDGIQIDDGWSMRTNNDTLIAPVPSKFPDMPGLANWVHSQGLKFGLYYEFQTNTSANFKGGMWNLTYIANDANWMANTCHIDYIKVTALNEGISGTSQDILLHPDALYYPCMSTFVSTLVASGRQIEVYSIVPDHLPSRFTRWTSSALPDLQAGIDGVRFDGNVQNPNGTGGVFTNSMLHAKYAQLIGATSPGHYMSAASVGGSYESNGSLQSVISTFAMVPTPLIIDEINTAKAAFWTNYWVYRILKDSGVFPSRSVLQTNVSGVTNEVWVRDLADFVGRKAVLFYNMALTTQSITVTMTNLGMSSTISVFDPLANGNAGFWDSYQNTNWSVTIPPYNSKIYIVKNGKLPIESTMASGWPGFTLDTTKRFANLDGVTASGSEAPTQMRGGSQPWLIGPLFIGISVVRPGTNVTVAIRTNGVDLMTASVLGVNDYSHGTNVNQFLVPADALMGVTAVGNNVTSDSPNVFWRYGQVIKGLQEP